MDEHDGGYVLWIGELWFSDKYVCASFYLGYNILILLAHSICLLLAMIV